jgi:hypothetical protein
VSPNGAYCIRGEVRTAARSWGENLHRNLLICISVRDRNDFYRNSEKYSKVYEKHSRIYYKN